MSDYIFKPPPPPPPKAAAPSPQQQQANRGNNRGRGGNRGRGRGRGGPGGGGGRGRGGSYNTGVPHTNSSNGYGNTYDSPHTSASSTPNVHLNPAFFPNHAVPQQPAPSPAPAPASATNPAPQLQPSSKNLFFAPKQLVETAPLPAPVQSYGQFVPPVPASAEPPAKRQKTSKPDMDPAHWYALNNGKLLGTNIKPPETPEEIAEWIAERKKRFPTAAMRAQKEAEEAERREKERKKEEGMLEKRLERARLEREAALEKAKAEGKAVDADEDGESSDDDGPPEEAGTKERTVFRDDTKKGQPAKKERAICRNFRAKGSCSNPRCKFRHEVPEKGQGPTRKGPPEKKSLYQLFVENDRLHENKLVLEVLEYWVETGVLKEEEESAENKS